MVSLITVTDDTVEKHGFFCKMSARKTSAWKRKRAWLSDRFTEGLQLRLLGDGARGFVEFIPAQHAWRGDGLTALYSAQCPYLEDAVAHARAAAEDADLPFRAIEIHTTSEMRQLVPNPYGVFSLVLNGKEIASHYLLKKQIMPLLAVS